MPCTFLTARVIGTGPKIPTEFGPVQCTSLDEERVHHVGYEPDPWNWAPWEFAQGRRFTGRWDDPGGEWRGQIRGGYPGGVLSRSITSCAWVIGPHHA
ncbi:MAG: hypothetical protein QOE72_4225 [Chloroflexota bacterium]|jgi:hypothetical protein|nr:hypothetical protein [Chloroflexota bacterium]